MLASRIRTIFAAVALSAIVVAPAAAENEHLAPMKALAAGKVKAWVSDPVVIASIRAQNAAHASLTQDDIDRLDKTWRNEVKAGGGDMTKKTLANQLSAYLKKVKTEGQGLYTEIFIMDNKGLNVGQSDMTSDYWQGDEPKWQQTFSVGPDAIHISKIAVDESSQILQSQLSLSIVDPDSGKVIGAVTVGINVEQLGQ